MFDEFESVGEFGADDAENVEFDGAGAACAPAPRAPQGNPGFPEGEEGEAMLDRMNGGHHEELANWAFQYISFNGAKRALDVGCGGGANIARMLERMPEGEVWGIDHSELAVEKTLTYNIDAVRARRSGAILGDVANMGFTDEAFDIVTAFETIYFWPDPYAGLREIYRVLVPGGTLLICNEADGSSSDSYVLAMTIKGMNIYTPRELDGMMDTMGFVDVKIYNDIERGSVCVIAKRPMQ